MFKIFVLLLYCSIFIKCDIINLKNNLINELKNELDNLGSPNITIEEILIHIKNNNLLRFDEITQNIDYKIPKLYINYGNLSNIIYNEFENALNNDVFNYNTNFKLVRFTNLKKYMLKICKKNMLKICKKNI